MSARLITVADAVVTNIIALWDAATPPRQGEDDCTRCYEFLFDTQKQGGRKVFVLPNLWARPAAATRREDYRDHELDIFICERYAGPAPTPNEWMDERVAFVEAIVWRPLADPRQPQVLSGVYPLASTVLAYDRDDLVKKKTFVSQVSITLQELI